MNNSPRVCVEIVLLLPPQNQGFHPQPQPQPQPRLLLLTTTRSVALTAMLINMSGAEESCMPFASICCSMALRMRRLSRSEISTSSMPGLKNA